MKKMFTLLLSVTMFASAFAQYDRNDDKDHGYGKGNDVAYNDNRYKKDDKGWNDRYYFSKKEMEMQIADINRDFDRKVRNVKSNWFMTRFRKERILRDLEDQRRMEIRKVVAKFNSPKNKFDDRDRDYRDKDYKKNW